MATYIEQHLSNDNVLEAQLDRVVEVSWVFLRRGNLGSIFDKFAHLSSFTGIHQPVRAEILVC